MSRPAMIETSDPAMVPVVVTSAASSGATSSCRMSPLPGGWMPARIETVPPVLIAESIVVLPTERVEMPPVPAVSTVLANSSP